MFDQNGHLSDEVIIRLIDDEGFIPETDEVRVHCAQCLVCRSRRSQLEQALSKFADLYSSTMKPTTLEPGVERRVEFQNRLAVAANLKHQPRWPGRLIQSGGYLFIALAI